MSKKSIRPLGEYVLIGVLENHEPIKSKTGLVMPPTNNNKSSGSLCRGKIIELPKMEDAKPKSLQPLAEGQVVLYPEWAGHVIEEVSGSYSDDSIYSGQEYKKIALVKAEEIKAIVEGTDV